MIFALWGFQTQVFSRFMCSERIIYQLTAFIARRERWLYLFIFLILMQTPDGMPHGEITYQQTGLRVLQKQYHNVANCDVTWASCRLELPATGRFVRQFVHETSPKLHINVPLWGDSTGDRWIPLTKGQWYSIRVHVMRSSCNAWSFRPLTPITGGETPRITQVSARITREICQGIGKVVSLHALVLGIHWSDAETTRWHCKKSVSKIMGVALIKFLLTRVWN